MHFTSNDITAVQQRTVKVKCSPRARVTFKIPMVGIKKMVVSSQSLHSSSCHPHLHCTIHTIRSRFEKAFHSRHSLKHHKDNNVTVYYFRPAVIS